MCTHQTCHFIRRATLRKLLDLRGPLAAETSMPVTYSVYVIPEHTPPLVIYHG